MYQAAITCIYPKISKFGHFLCSRQSQQQITVRTVQEIDSMMSICWCQKKLKNNFEILLWQKWCTGQGHCLIWKSCSFELSISGCRFANQRTVWQVQGDLTSAGWAGHYIDHFDMLECYFGHGMCEICMKWAVNGFVLFFWDCEKSLYFFISLKSA